MTKFNFHTHSSSLANLPQQPGVYKMLDAQGEVLYVGKAINLKKRVSSYFSRAAQTTKTRSLVEQIAEIDVTVTRSETEALILESSWIKLFHPKYNILMRDDKSYPFIYLSEHPLFPSISMVRRKKKPNASHFYGPYPNAAAVHKTIHLIHKLFKIRNCNDVYFAHRTRPCLQYQIKRCTAPCVHFISAEQYREAVQDAKHFLQGKSQQILEDLTARMQVAVDRLAYEEAAVLRDQIKHLRTIQEEQSMVRASGNVDVIVLEAYPGFACVQVVQIRQGEVIASDHYFPAVPAENLANDLDLWQQVFAAFLTQYYVDMPDRIPRQIITDRVVIECELLASVLSTVKGKSCQIKVPKRGLARRWLDFAQNNLEQSINKHHTAKTAIQVRLRALAEWMHLPHPIKKIECFDVSHFQGAATVASCVVFDEQGPAKRAYRRFNIQGVNASDDYAAMEQALTRCYTNQDHVWPDILIVDGGKGQVAVAKRVLTQLGVKTVAILGVAKGPTRKSGRESLIIATARQEESILPEHSPARHLIQFIRDEAHRFAIQAHRKKRNKSSLSNTLESLTGIGPKRRKALLQRFGGMRELSKAPIEELLKVRGISLDLAKKIYDFLHTGLT